MSRLCIGSDCGIFEQLAGDSTSESSSVSAAGSVLEDAFLAFLKLALCGGSFGLAHSLLVSQSLGRRTPKGLSLDASFATVGVGNFRRCVRGAADWVRRTKSSGSQSMQA